MIFIDYRSIVRLCSGEYVHRRDSRKFFSSSRRRSTSKRPVIEEQNSSTNDHFQGLTDDDYDMYYEKWQHFDPSGCQFIHYDHLSDFVAGLEPPLRIPKPNQLLLIAMDLPLCENDRLHCVDILDGLTKHFLGTWDVSSGAASEAPMDIKKDRPKDYHPIKTTVQRQREHYLARIGLKGFRTHIERCRSKRQHREPILERAMIDELIEFDELSTPASVGCQDNILHSK